MVGTRLTDLQLNGFGLVLEHERLDVATRPEEWSIETFLQAAFKTLDLLIELHGQGLTLVDAHNKNVSMLPGGAVVWHDFGSIIETQRGVLPSLDEFLTHYFFPLMLYHQTGSFSMIRRMNMGCSADEFNRLRNPLLIQLSDRVSSLPGGQRFQNLLVNRAQGSRAVKLGVVDRLSLNITDHPKKQARSQDEEKCTRHSGCSVRGQGQRHQH